MEISPIPTLSKEINKIRESTASIVADQIIPNEAKIYKGGDNAKALREEIRSEVKKKKLWLHICLKNMAAWELGLWHTLT